MDKFLKISEMRSLELMFIKDDISYSRMVEIINLKAQKYYNENYTLTNVEKENKPYSETLSEFEVRQLEQFNPILKNV